MIYLDDFFRSNPIFINSSESIHGHVSLFWSITTNQNTIWILQITNRGSLSEKLRRWENLKRKLYNFTYNSLINKNMMFTLKWVSCFCILSQNSFYSFCRSDGDCWFFNNDFESFSFRSNSSGTCFNIFQISSTPLSNTISFCWRVHTYKNKICTFYMTIDEFPEILIFSITVITAKGSILRSNSKLETFLSTSEEKKRFLPLAALTTSSNPGS